MGTMKLSTTLVGLLLVTLCATAISGEKKTQEKNDNAGEKELENSLGEKEPEAEEEDAEKSPEESSELEENEKELEASEKELMEPEDGEDQVKFARRRRRRFSSRRRRYVSRGRVLTS